MDRSISISLRSLPLRSALAAVLLLAVPAHAEVVRVELDVAGYLCGL